MTATMVGRRYGTSPRLWGDLLQQETPTACARYIPTLVGRLQVYDRCGEGIAVHPHACGEIGCAEPIQPLTDGTSPRLWGDFAEQFEDLRHCRYIPTLVGRLSTVLGLYDAMTVHPHACGEISLQMNCCVMATGTSPRLWGDFFIAQNLGDTFRYIPTLVGRLQWGETGWGTCPVHPHACGEILPSHASDKPDVGTSPRLWGDSASKAHTGRPRRYIPTLVGRFAWRTFIDAQPEVHPHACGEIQTAIGRAASSAGTSPRLWGDSQSPRQSPPEIRYIPTLVGRLMILQASHLLSPVHPHACGEICAWGNRFCRYIGTSPRLWGDCIGHSDKTVWGRYIPTLVGRFIGTTVISLTLSVHPHACGEIGGYWNVVGYIFGTSPRLWGD